MSGWGTDDERSSRSACSKTREYRSAGRQDPGAAPARPFGGEVPVEVAPIHTLLPPDSPRLAGEDHDHTRRLAQTEVRLPPIVVHQCTRRVIDGLHRLRAAALRGEESIEVQFFDGSEAEAFVLAVQANVTHGLRLSLADRRAAAARIIASYPAWSDRAIAAVTGLAPRTVCSVRRQSSAPVPDNDRRVGLDGRVHPLDHAARRRVASEIIVAHPEASLRAVAKAAGISPTTARDVRMRIQRGEAPWADRDRSLDGDAHERLRQHLTGVDGENRPRHAGQNRASLMASLRNDPSLRFTDTGRTLLRWLLPRAAGAAGWSEVVGSVPPHCVYLIARVARSCAQEWIELAEHMDQLADAMT